MSKQKVILFDIDYTLFNARMYRDKFLQKIFEALAYPDWEAFLEIEEEVYKVNKKKYGYFEPIPFLEDLEKKFNKKLDIQTLQHVFTDESILEQSLYKETMSVLENLARRKDFLLGIFSAGRVHIQGAKIKPVKEFLHAEHIHIFEFSKKHALESLLKQYVDHEILLIDDILEILYNAKKLRDDIVTVWIKRGQTTVLPEVQQEVTRDGFVPDYTIENLEALVSIVS